MLSDAKKTPNDFNNRLDRLSKKSAKAFFDIIKSKM